VKTNGQRRLGKSFIVSLMLFLWLGTTALAVSPQLHQRLHKDSKSLTHECLVTFFSKSQLFAGGTGSVFLGIVPLLVGALLTAESSSFSIIDYRLSPSRAPPGRPSSNPVVG